MGAITEIWNLIFVNPLLNGLMFFYKIFGGNMGLAIIGLSLAVKFASFPLTHKSLKVMQKQKDLMPELDKLKKKYGHDKKVLAEKQLELYQKVGINPASGCAMQILPILIIIALFSVINHTFDPAANSVEALNAKLYIDFIKLDVGSAINSAFLYMDLSKPDKFFILPVLAAILQFLMSKMMMPVVHKAEQLARKTDDKKDDVMYNMQEQMLYMMPIVFLIVGLKLPSGVVLNILVTTLFSLVQQYLISGFGGLAPWVKKLGLKAE